MRFGLARSLVYLHEFTLEELSVPKASLDAGIKMIKEHLLLPDCFAAYYELVHAVNSQDFTRAQTLFEEVLDTKNASEELEFFAFNDPETDPRSRRYKSMVDTDPDLPFAIRPISVKTFEQASKLLDESLDLIEECAPELYDEITEILRVICLGVGPEEKGAYTFDGASAFELWGAIVLNANEARDVVDLVQTLAHESCHVMLFGYCIDGTLVHNPDDELHASPLRADPRPIDGIFHATFILARMHYAAKKLAESGLLDASLQTKAEDEIARRKASFYDGLGTLKKHARYSKEGEALMLAAEAYMDTSS